MDKLTIVYFRKKMLSSSDTARESMFYFMRTQMNELIENQEIHLLSLEYKIAFVVFNRNNPIKLASYGFIT